MENRGLLSHNQHVESGTTHLMFDDVTMTTTGNLSVADVTSVNRCNLQVYSHIN